MTTTNAKCEADSKIFCAFNNLSQAEKNDFTWQKVNGKYGYYNKDGKTILDLVENNK